MNSKKARVKNLAAMIIKGDEYKKGFEKLSNSAIIKLLQTRLWQNMIIYSKDAMLLEDVCDRLRDAEQRVHQPSGGGTSPAQTDESATEIENGKAGTILKG